MSEELEACPWIGFRRGTPRRQEVVQALNLPSARLKVAKAMRCDVSLVDAFVVAEGEDLEAAKKRVAEMAT